MVRRLHDLSLDECEIWMRELGLLDEGKLDWPRLMKLAPVKGTKDNLRLRWKKWEAPQQRKKIREALETLEAKRRQPTAFWLVLQELERWHAIGIALSQRPEVFEAALAAAGGLALKVEASKAHGQARETAEADLQAGMSVFQTITPEPEAKPKKRSASSRPDFTPVPTTRK